MHISIPRLLVISSALVFPIFASAQVITETQKLTPATIAAGDNFGHFVGVSGDFAVVGARRDDVGDANSNEGSVYILGRNPSTGVWEVVAKFSGNAPNDLLSLTGVAISGDVAAAASLEAAASDGEVHVFERDTVTGTWSKTIELPNPSSPGDRNAASVAIGANTIVVGVEALSTIGGVFVYTKDAVLGWTLTQTLTPPDGSSLDTFGHSLSISGSTLVVGSVLDDDKGPDSGSVYVFDRDLATGVWSFSQKLTASDGTANDVFGVSVSVTGDTLAVGAYLDDVSDADTNEGSIYIFQRIGGVWSQAAKVTASDAAPGDQFGQEVSVSGGTLVVGAPFVDAGSSDADPADAGAVYAFQKIGGTWTQVNKLVASSPQFGALLGAFVSISGDTVIAGAADSDEEGTDSGSAFVFIVAQPDPADQINDLSDLIDGLVADGGIAKSLKAKLRAARKKLLDNNNMNDKAAVRIIVALINELEALRGNGLATAAADLLLSEAQAILAALNS